MKSKLHILMLLALSMAANAEQTVLLKMSGLDKDSELYNNVRIYLSQISNDEADGSEFYQERVQQTIDKALRALGYYNTQYHFSITPKPHPQKDWLNLQIVLDKEPVRIDETDIQVQGGVAQDEQFLRLLENGVPKKGEILNHSIYDDFKSNLDKTAQSRGYFDGEWNYHRLEVYPQDHIADWRLGYSSGERYRYGQIAFKDSQIREDYLRNILRIKMDDPYHLNDLSKLSSDFSASGWFTSVLVEPIVNEEPKTVDLNVLLIPRKKNEMEIGIGYATDVGPRLQFNWKKPWLNDRGHSLETNTYISKPEQSFQFGYNIPVKAHPLQYYYQISGGVEREDQNDTNTRAAHLGFQRFWNHETGWAFSLGIKARYDSFAQGQDKFKTLLLYPTASISRTRSDGNRFPLWGDSQRLTINWGNKAWGSDVNFYSAKASTAWVRTFKNNHRFYVRGEIGYLETGDFPRIPPALRYFAGGDLSVRGFGYKKISPLDPKGELSGGTHLLTGTAEYQYQIYPNWWAAAFYDAGLAAKEYKSENLHHGAGLGVRWASPIGAIKFDLAVPVNSPSNDKGVKFYIGIGSDL